MHFQRVSQRFYNILLTYLLYFSSYNKNSWTFKVVTIVLYCLMPPFYQFFWFHTDTSSCPSRGRSPSLKLLPPHGCWSMVHRKWTMDQNKEAKSRLYAQVWYQFDSFKFLEFIPETNTNANIAKLLSPPRFIISMATYYRVVGINAD